MLYLKCSKDKKESEEMKKFNINSKGFTLIELLAVITILGILMLVAIPNVTRTIENSRRDTFADLAKQYVNTVRNAVLADELTCKINNVDTSVGGTGDGSYYFKIDSSAPGGSNDLMENSSKSPWSSSDVAGYVSWAKTPDAASGNNPAKTTTKYSIVLVDNGKHGIMGTSSANGTEAVSENMISRANVSTKTDLSASDKAKLVPVNTSSITYNLCTLK